MPRLSSHVAEWLEVTYKQHVHIDFNYSIGQVKYQRVTWVLKGYLSLFKTYQLFTPPPEGWNVHLSGNKKRSTHLHTFMFLNCLFPCGLASMFHFYWTGMLFPIRCRCIFFMGRESSILFCFQSGFLIFL